MLKTALPIHRGLFDFTRFPLRTQRSVDHAQLMDVLWLLALGVGAGVVTSVWDFQLKVPGHAILRSVPLLAVGLATVPRRNAGWLLGLGAAVGVLGVHLCGGSTPGLGAGTSLLLLGPVLEWALRSATTGMRIYRSFVWAGLISNLAAFATRATPKLMGWEASRGKPFAAWAPMALASYVVCGVLAGLISAWICFRLRDRARTRPEGSAP